MKEKILYAFLAVALLLMSGICYFTGEIVAYQSQNPADLITFKQEVIAQFQRDESNTNTIVKYINAQSAKK